MTGTRSISCEAVDELSAAFALGALEPAEEIGVSDHLATCGRSHDEARAAIEAAYLVPVALDPVQPSAALRERLMATVAATPQDHVLRPAQLAASPRVPVEAAVPRRPWWQLSPLPSALAAVGLAAAVGLGAWGVSLNAELAERDAALRAVASADVAHQVTGSAGSGWVLESDGQALFLADDLSDLPADRIYELWIIGADGVPVAVGTLDDTEGLAVVTLERGLASATAFAVTVERERVEAPTGEPVLLAALDA